MGGGGGQVTIPKFHVPWENIPDKFADEVVAILMPGVRHCTCPRENDESPGKRSKVNNQQ